MMNENKPKMRRKHYRMLVRLLLNSLMRDTSFPQVMIIMAAEHRFLLRRKSQIVSTQDGPYPLEGRRWCWRSVFWHGSILRCLPVIGLKKFHSRARATR